MRIILLPRSVGADVIQLGIAGALESLRLPEEFFDVRPSCHDSE